MIHKISSYHPNTIFNVLKILFGFKPNFKKHEFKHYVVYYFKSDSLNLNHSLRLSLTITLFYLLTIILCWTPLQCSLYLWHLFWGLFLQTPPHTQTQMSSEQSFKWKEKKMISYDSFFLIAGIKRKHDILFLNRSNLYFRCLDEFQMFIWCHLFSALRLGYFRVFLISR